MSLSDTLTAAQLVEEHQEMIGTLSGVIGPDALQKPTICLGLPKMRANQRRALHTQPLAPTPLLAHPLDFLERRKALYMYRGKQLSSGAKQRTEPVMKPQLAEDLADVVARSALGGPSVGQER